MYAEVDDMSVLKEVASSNYLLEELSMLVDLSKFADWSDIECKIMNLISNADDDALLRIKEAVIDELESREWLKS